MKIYSTRYLFWGWLIITFLTSSLEAQTAKTVKFSTDMTLRQIAKKYLNDSNLWEEILKVNNLKSITELEDGMLLILPEDVVTKSEKEIANALKLIQQATTAGARIFTPELISESIELRNKAIGERLLKNWGKAIDYASQSINVAKKALQESINKNDVSVQAILSDRRGTVQDKPEDALVWDDTPENASLNENQKIRTLSESFAEISFKDDSRLRLNSNSQAVIQKMRMNLIENKQESEVSLLEGDIYALLSGSPRRKMNIDVPGVDTEINSKKFWINRDANDIKVANYDGEIKLKTTESTLTLEKNKGTMLGSDGTPMKPTDLLPKPLATFPAHNSVYYKSGESNSVLFKWDRIEGAVSYWLEIGYERSSFSKTVLSRPNIKDNEIEISGFEVDGAYYWRVAAIDGYGFPGNTSDATLVKVITDTTKPYLYIHTPSENELFSQKSLKIIGETEAGISLKINDTEITTNDEGEFDFPVNLLNGENLFTFTAVDVAGNSYSLSRKVYFSPLEEVQSNIRKSLPVSENGRLEIPGTGGVLAGKIIPKAKIKLFAPEKNFYAKSVSDSSGNYSFSLPDKLSDNQISFSVQAENGVEDSEDYVISTESHAPVIKLMKRIPGFTKSSMLDIELNFSYTDFIELNGEMINVGKNEVFHETIKLTPGENLVLINAYNKWGKSSNIVESVIFDDAAPEYVSHKIKPVENDLFRVNITLDFNEKSKAARIAQYILNTDKHQYTGFLILNDFTNVYQGTLYLPEGNGKTPLLKKITLTDIYGNTQTIEF